MAFKPKFRKGPESILLIPGGIEPDSLTGYWEQSEKLERPRLQRGGCRYLFECQVRVPRLQVVRHSRPAGQFRQQRLKTLYCKTVRRLVGMLLSLGRGGRFGRPNRIAALPFLGPLLILEQNRRPSPAQVPFHVVGQQA